MTTGDEKQRAVIERATTELPADERILAVYLIGSYGSGQADRFSDVDVHLVVTDDSVDWFTEHWDDVLRKVSGPTVLADPIPGLVGGLGITADWLHVDLVVHPLEAFDRFQYDGSGCCSTATARCSRTATSPRPAAALVSRTGRPHR